MRQDFANGIPTHVPAIVVWRLWPEHQWEVDVQRLCDRLLQTAFPRMFRQSWFGGSARNISGKWICRGCATGFRKVPKPFVLPLQIFGIT